MLSNARSTMVAIQLLVVASTCILVGAAGVLAFTAGWMGQQLGQLLATELSFACMMAGISLLGVLKDWYRLRIVAALWLGAWGVNSLWLADGGGESATMPLFLGGGKGADLLPTAMVIATAGCLILGVKSASGRIAAIVVGGGLLVYGGVELFGLLALDYFLIPTAFGSALLPGFFFILGLGATLLLLGLTRWQSIPLGKLPQYAALGGVFLSVVVWLLMASYQQRSILERAEHLLDNVQFSAEQALRGHLQLLARMSRRLEAMETVDERVFRSDIQSYLDDAPSLAAIGLFDSNWNWTWQVARTPEDSQWLNSRVDASQVREWLTIPYTQPRLLLPDSDDHARALLAVAVPTRDDTLLVNLDLVALLRQELHLQMGIFQVHVARRGNFLFVLAADGPFFYAPASDQWITRREIGLPGGVTVELALYPSHAGVWSSVMVMPFAVSLGGLLLTLVLAFSLGMTSLAMGRSRQLLAARDEITAQQIIQEMIVREEPLAEVLDMTCEKVESQLPGVICSIMLVGAEGQHLELVAGRGLPAVYREAIKAIDIGPDVGSCGSAAFHRTVMVSEDIEIDPRWTLVKDVIAQTSLRACWSSPVIGTDGAVLGTFGMYRTVPERPSDAEMLYIAKVTALVVLAIEKSRVSGVLRTLKRSIEASVNGVLIADATQPQLPIVYSNRAFSEITGYSREEVLGRNCRFLQGAGTDRSAVETIRRQLLQQREVHVTLRNYRKDGSSFWNDLYVSPVRDGNGKVTHFVGLQNDISDRIAYEEQLTYNASHDLLTGLFNRTMLEDRLNHGFELSRRHGYWLAVLFIDLDGFKPINDTLGHDLGDMVLVEVGRRIKLNIRAGDTVARLGGDEFVVVMPDLGMQKVAGQKAEVLLSALAEAYHVQGQELHLTASIGIAISDDAISNPQELLRQADMAMYKAKQKGHNNWQLYTSDITQAVSDQVAIRNELQSALAKEEFELAYQPLLTASRELVGVEALLRWRHPQRGFISPADFISLAESTGQIIPISEWVLERACHDMRRLLEHGLGQVKVSVNLSPLQFHRSNFLSNLRNTLLRTGLPASQLELELTEGILMNDAEGAINLLHALKAMEIDVSIDDFGTGFSSLAYLRELPISKIKIDRLFVRDVNMNSDNAAIVRGVVSMAHHMGLMVVAEGVETEEQREFLMELGCDIFQGYLLARPMSISRLKQFIASLPGSRGESSAIA